MLTRINFLFLQEEGRGVKDPERLRREKRKREDADREAQRSGNPDNHLKVCFEFWHGVHRGGCFSHY